MRASERLPQQLALLLPVILSHVPPPNLFPPFLLAVFAPPAASLGWELRPAVPTARSGLVPLAWVFDPRGAAIVAPPALNAAKPGERGFPSILGNHETSAAVAYRSWHGSTFPSRRPPALPAGLAAIIRKHLVSAYPLRDTVVARSTLSRAEHRQRRPSEWAAPGALTMATMLALTASGTVGKIGRSVRIEGALLQ